MPSLSSPSNIDRQILRHLFRQIICFVLWVSGWFFLNNLHYWYFLYCFGFILKKKYLVEKVNIYNQQLNIWRSIVLVDGVERLLMSKKVNFLSKKKLGKLGKKSQLTMINKKTFWATKCECMFPWYGNLMTVLE